ncbi:MULTISPECIES: PepSY-associated TM helix domain-containing protein [Shewanella]|uniref:PepSY-associated TM helix domain-containing protein n=1 Tax=Shewanella metallivivens TaxID=2872342 RepID=A0ABT5TKA9_9GAMM|nr:PepSY-associated TM helix domain-containing protein [Shewanella metallivivens]MDD8059048.1 PepSY-associated TM helix domain-containing protein [Shewanella metallivivens]
MNMVSILKWLHNWIGFVISITMLIVLTTGVYLGSVDLLKRTDNLGQTFVPLTIEQKAETLATVFERYPEMSTVRFPTEHTPYIQATARGKAIALDSELNELASRASFDLPFYETVFWLHRNFLIDNGGKYINAWASLAGAIVTLIGIYLWWRVRNGFRLKQTLPKNTRSSSLLKSHIQLGLFISIPLFILCLSGFLITYNSLWTGALNQKPVTQSFPLSQGNDWLSQLNSAQQVWPDAELVSVSKPRSKPGKKPTPKMQGDAIKPLAQMFSIQFDEHPGVWLREADRISINHTTGVIESALKHSERPLSGRIASFVRPLHDGLNMPASYVALITLVSLIGTGILSFSLVTFCRRTFGRKAKKAA